MIRLKEQLKSISSNKLSKIKKIAKEMRRELETYHDWKSDKSCFGGKCHSISQQLVNKLKKEGIYAYRQMGEYAGADESYVPNMTDWKEWEREEYLDTWEVEGGAGMVYAHWWVVAENKFIIDITSDQFFPGKEDEHRVIITTINDEHYI